LTSHHSYLKHHRAANIDLFLTQVVISKNCILKLEWI
jgi:hypothetical protein